MHRDINPNNLAVTSLHNPTGIIIDLDSATTSPISTNHTRGTLPYLAPEIMALKLWKQGMKRPPPYGRIIDTWALGLSMYALHCGQPIRWAHFAATDTSTTTYVSSDAYESFRAKLLQDSLAEQDSDTQDFLLSVPEITMYEAEGRVLTPVDTSAFLSRTKHSRGTLVTKRKRAREE
ncbi:MAG: hypothetical protein Q9222_003118 [Ikaeria aurantiellina]